MTRRGPMRVGELPAPGAHHAVGQDVRRVRQLQPCGPTSQSSALMAPFEGAVAELDAVDDEQHPEAGPRNAPAMKGLADERVHGANSNRAELPQPSAAVASLHVAGGDVEPDGVLLAGIGHGLACRDDRAAGLGLVEEPAGARPGRRGRARPARASRSRSSRGCPGPRGAGMPGMLASFQGVPLGHPHERLHGGRDVGCGHHPSGPYPVCRACSPPARTHSRGPRGLVHRGVRVGVVAGAAACRRPTRRRHRRSTRRTSPPSASVAASSPKACASTRCWNSASLGLPSGRPSGKSHHSPRGGAVCLRCGCRSSPAPPSPALPLRRRVRAYSRYAYTAVRPGVNSTTSHFVLAQPAAPLPARSPCAPRRGRTGCPHRTGGCRRPCRWCRRLRAPQGGRWGTRC